MSAAPVLAPPSALPATAAAATSAAFAQETEAAPQAAEAAPEDADADADAHPEAEAGTAGTAEAGAEAGSEPEAEPEASSEPAADAEANPEPDFEPDPEPQPSPQPSGRSSGRAAVYGNYSFVPASCQRVAVFEAERTRRAALQNGSCLSTTHRAGWGFLLGGPNKIAGAMLVLQRRRRRERCETASSFYHDCYVGEETAPLYPNNQYWHVYNKKAQAYILPVDLGRMGVAKDSGRCSIALARSSGWFDSPATSSIRLQINTFNGQVRRWGLASATFTFDMGGMASVKVEGVSSSDPQLVYRSQAYPLITLESFMLLILTYDLAVSAIA